MLKTVLIPKKNRYVMTLPNEYLNRQIEILVFPFDSDRIDQESPQTLQLEETARTTSGEISEDQKQLSDAVAAVRETWASIPLDLKTAIYIAEDKELEYDV